MAITQAMCTSFKVELMQAVHNFTNTTGNTFKPALFRAQASIVGTFGAGTTNYSDMGAETDGVSLITWAAEQIGLTFPDTYSKAVAACTSHITVDQALKTRGSLLIGPDRFAVTLGLDDVIDVVNGRYFVYRMKDSQRANWNTGAKLPGAIY